MADLASGVLISQPVHQHAYETAVAAQEAGLLGCFVTGLYYTGRGLTSPRVLAWLPSVVSGQIDRELRRRWHPQLRSADVVSIPRYHALATGLRRSTARLPWLRDLNFETWAHQHFDEAVACRLGQFPPFKAVHGFEGSALSTFRAARRRGILTILDVPSAYERFTAVEREGRPTGLRIQAERELADYLFAPSDFVIGCLTDAGVPAERIVKIPFAVDTSRFRPVGERRPEEPFRALFVGQISVRKGVHFLLEAWRRLALPGAELILVGHANRAGRQLLKRYAGVGVWVGSVPKHEVHGWFAASDLFVFPSLAEGSALVTYEAMAAGLPLITTANSGSIMRDGLDGLLTPPGDIDALVDRIEALYQDPNLRRCMGASARQLVHAQYTWAHYRRRVAAAYRLILSRQPDQPAPERADAGSM